MTEPTDAEIFVVAREAGLLPDNSHPAPETRAARKHSNAVQAFARAVLAKWGTPPAVAGEPMAEVISTNGLEAEFTCEMLHGHVPALGAFVYLTTPQPTQAQAGAVTADDLKQPRNGAQWRVEWWNESCRMLLPANKRLDSFQAYRNGTLMFTIKEKSSIKGGQHGADT